MTRTSLTLVLLSFAGMMTLTACDRETAEGPAPNSTATIDNDLEVIDASADGLTASETDLGGDGAMAIENESRSVEGNEGSNAF